MMKSADLRDRHDATIAGRGESGTLGNRFRPRVLTHTETHQRTPHQRLPATTVCVRVFPQITVGDLGFREYLTQF
jgi:hypothetical protein